MTLEMLQQAKITAMKNKDMKTRDILTNMIDSVQKAAITSKGRVEITEQLVNEVLIKYQKSVQEQIDTCPATRADLLTKYNAEMNVVRQYAPQLIADPNEIKNLILDTINGEIEFTKSNKGKIMKIISPIFKNKADMKIVGQVVGGMLV